MSGWRSRYRTSSVRSVAMCVLAGMLAFGQLFPPPAVRAAADTFFLGTGNDGSLTVTNAGTIINAYAPVTQPLSPGDSTLSIGSVVGTGLFSPGDVLLILQTSGLVPEPASGASSPIDLSSNPVGRWELARIASVSGSSVTLTGAVQYSYAAQVSQVVRVPEYTSVTINATRSITALPWNGSVGGVIAFLATGGVTNNGQITASAAGFRGGQSLSDASTTVGCTGLDEAAPQGGQKGEGIAASSYGPGSTGLGRIANGGGGGVCLSAGGGGGSNGGSGGQGGNSDLSTDGNRAVGGQGGVALSFAVLDHLLLGGGGGAGHAADAGGGNGGGIIFLRAGTLSGTGTMTANGGTGGSSGAGQVSGSGGGGGGTISIRIAGSAACGLLRAIGGTGGNSNGGIQVGPGGGGGGGRMLLQKGSGTCTTTASSVIGGSAGVQQDASAPGGSTYGATGGVTGSTTVLTSGFAQIPVPVVTTPVHGSLSNNPFPTYSGTIATSAPAGTQVAVFVDGSERTRATPDASGNWSATPVASLASGIHTVYAIGINTAQATQSHPSNTTTFTVDTTPPPAPLVLAPTNGSTITTHLPAISGTAEPNTSVNVIVDSTSVGTVTTDASGNWSLTPASALPDGSHTVQATAADNVGNVSLLSTSITFTIDTTPPPAPLVLAPADGSTIATPQPTISGTAEPNTLVNVVVDGTSGDTATTDASGNWSLTLASALSDGSHTVQATATDNVGNVSQPSTITTFTVDTTPTTTPTNTPTTTPTNTPTTTPTNTPTTTPTNTPTPTITQLYLPLMQSP